MRIRDSKTNTRQYLALASVALLGAALAAPASAKVFSLGDSYLDNGNLDAVTGGSQPGLQYWAGRFTNGWTVAERVTFRLTNAAPGRAPGLNGIQYPSGTSAAGGVDFAHGGATAITRSGLPKHLSVYNQAIYFRTETAAKRITVTKQDSALLWAGLNDYLAYNATNAKSVASNIANQIISQFVLTGVGKIAVLNLPNMGDLPGWIDGSQRSSLNSLTATHNAELARLLTARQPKTAPRLILVDVNRALALAHQGLAGGFTVTRPGQNGSASGNCLGDGKVLWDCTANYLYYDYVHLNSSGHEYLASIVEDRLNSVSVQSAQAQIAISGASSSSSSQSQYLAARIAAAQEGYSGVMSFGALGAAPGDADGSASLSFGASASQISNPGGNLSVYSYGDAASLLEDNSVVSDRRFGFGADWTEGAWIAGASAFRTDPGTDDRRRDAEFALQQSLSGATAYLAWTAQNASVSLATTYAQGEQETQRHSAVQGLPWATGRTRVASSSATMTGSAREAWGPIALTADAALVYDDTLVSGYQESGTLGLSDTVYDDAVSRGLVGRVGAELSYSDDAADLSFGAHYLSRLSGNASLWSAVPVSLPSQSMTKFDTDARAPLALDDRAAAVWASASWRWSEHGSLNLGAAAIATQDGDVAGGVSLGANYKF